MKGMITAKSMITALIVVLLGLNWFSSDLSNERKYIELTKTSIQLIELYRSKEQQKRDRSKSDK